MNLFSIFKLKIDCTAFIMAKNKLQINLNNMQKIHKKYQNISSNPQTHFEKTASLIYLFLKSAVFKK